MKQPTPAVFIRTPNFGYRKQPAPRRLLSEGATQRLLPSEDSWCSCGPSTFFFLLRLPLPTCPGLVSLGHAGTPGAPAAFLASMGRGQLDTGPGASSHFRKRVFRPEAGIKGHLSIPRCPAPAFPNNIPLCRPPRLLRPPPLSTLPPFTASEVGLFVCCAECKLSVVFLFSLPLMQPPSKPSLGTLRLGR